MSKDNAQLHLYQRTVDGDSNDSLSVIASLIEPGQNLLDLGMGAGGLGQYLSQRFSVVVDGATLNPAEADIARAWYRHAVVADLDQDNLANLFSGQQYDCIVCADVLEHLKAPQNLLAQCKALLKPGGRLITSVPNAAYCGLLAELIQGDFRYRPEGLLDSTHLRFFTRTSLQRFFAESGWATQFIKTTQRSLLESEFRVAFDSLPPAVARYLLALPDALTYQFISVLQAGNASDVPAISATSGVLNGAETGKPAVALFSAQLYLANQHPYDEATKLVAPGRIGAARQILTFDIPSSPQPYTRLRLDPADRPGFFRLHSLQIQLPNREVVWQWQAGLDPIALFSATEHQDIVISPYWDAMVGALLLLHGDDPWMELPLAPSLLQKIAQSGARFELCVGWPMSADYLQASTAIQSLVLSYQQSSAELQQKIEGLSQQRTQLEDKQQALQTQLNTVNTIAQDAENALSAATLGAKNALIQVTLEAQKEKQNLIEELRLAQRERNTHLDHFNQVASYLQGIEQSRLFRATRPLVHFKMWLDRQLGHSPKVETPSPSTSKPLPAPILASSHPVDIIVPVYRGLDDTRCCLESVLASYCQTAWRLIVINDCSPDPEVTQWLQAFAQRDSRILLLENHENLGFVGTVNRGMAQSLTNDVLLLNSDAEVANDWLDRIQRAAYSAPRVASVTPFSNNATICSYPRFCQANELPVGHDTASLDKLFAQYLAGQTVQVPTGVGFCMYIRRACLQQIGLFDVENFGKGYGEENDFCVRAQQAGWVNLHALDAFVRHAGGISFGDSKSGRELLAMETIRRLHPRYEIDVHAYVQRDPARQARLSIDLARITTSGRPVILNVMHNREGGTLRHVQELAQQLGGQATFLRLAPAAGGVDLRLEGAHETFSLYFELPSEHPRLLQTLRLLQVGHIHYHHLLDHVPAVCELPSQLGVRHDFTAHDYFSYCPQITLTDYIGRYCGEEGLEQCRQCLERNPAPDGESIESWRTRHGQLLKQARYLIAPSFDTAQRLQRFVPEAHIKVVSHASLYLSLIQHPKPCPRVLISGQRLKIIVLGALSKTKGADTLEEVSTLAAIHNIELEFHLCGYPYRHLRDLPRGLLTIHGAYQEKDLPQLLQSLQADVVWFPALWPESYSYTLSAALEAGLPIIAPNLGAFAERLQNREWTWLCNWYQSPHQWLELLNNIRHDHFCSGKSPITSAVLRQPALKDVDVNKQLMDYRSDYLAFIPLPDTPSVNQLRQLQMDIDFRRNESIRNGDELGVAKSANSHILCSIRRRVKLWFT